MNTNKLFKYFIICGALYYTVLSTIIMIINVALLSENSTKVIVPEQFLYLLLFCYIMALGSALRRVDVMSKALGWVLNATCYVLGFFIFLLCSEMSLPSALILCAAFIPIYVITAFTVSFIERKGSRTKKAKAECPKHAKTKKSIKSKDQETYTSMFS